MTTRRAFLATLAASTAVPRLGWAAAGAPAFLAAARDLDRSFALYGMDEAGEELFRIPLPGRAHAGAAHPTRPLAVVFARRPGTFALVLDCAAGAEIARIESPEGRHFMGHGCFSHDGRLLLTAENDFANSRGAIGLWRVQDWQRVGQWDSHGIGPHDIEPLPDSAAYVIANGGIQTHPDHGREKLNLETMRPNLAYIDDSGRLLDRVELPGDMHQASIRHLSVRGDGLVAFAMQFEGDVAEAVPLLGLHRIGTAPRLLTADAVAQLGLSGYVGAVAFSRDGREVAISSPVGGQIHVFAVDEARFLRRVSRPDVCGLGLAGDKMVATDGLGGLMFLDRAEPFVMARSRNWDNHVVTLT